MGEGREGEGEGGNDNEKEKEQEKEGEDDKGEGKGKEGSGRGGRGEWERRKESRQVEVFCNATWMPSRSIRTAGKIASRQPVGRRPYNKYCPTILVDGRAVGSC